MGGLSEAEMDAAAMAVLGMKLAAPTEDMFDIAAKDNDRTARPRMVMRHIVVRPLEAVQHDIAPTVLRNQMPP
jgi:hypothetical protein